MSFPKWWPWRKRPEGCSWHSGMVMVEPKPAPKPTHGMSCARCSKPVRRGDKFAVLQVAHKDCADPKMEGK
jgi:hypothetical protein